jgi:hypothetical protein
MWTPNAAALGRQPEQGAYLCFELVQAIKTEPDGAGPAHGKEI